MKGELEKRQSEVIAAMRFPLMVLLLFAHVLPMVSVPIEMNLSEMNIYHFISEGISHNLSRIRNPLFFFFSGFFFFRKLEEWNAGFYRSQLKETDTDDSGDIYKELCRHFFSLDGTG